MASCRVLHFPEGSVNCSVQKDERWGCYSKLTWAQMVESCTKWEFDENAPELGYNEFNLDSISKEMKTCYITFLIIER